MTAVTQVQRSFTIVREFDAPRVLVFQAWTDPHHLQWFANPGEEQTLSTTVDLRVGGAWRLQMVENPAKTYMTGGIYREIVQPERLVFSWGAPDGWPQIDPDRPEAGPLVTITLHDLAGRTEMVFKVEFGEEIAEDRVREFLDVGMVQGWNQTIDRLAPHLAGADD